MREIRIFVSSPDDARFERQRLDRVVERLNGELVGTARLKTIRWETSFYKAHATFQAQIPEAAECELVIAILRHRLGTELPAEFPKMPNGEPYPSGTAYEVLSAIEAGRLKGLPDVFVFRSSEPPTVRLDDVGNREIVEKQWARLKSFIQTWFLTAQGQFKAAFQSFGSTDDFEAQVEKLLRQWIEEHILKGRTVVWPIEIKGSPFRGLKAFGARHASVFFGRRRDTERASELWKDVAEAGTPFLLVIGASGAGKSSLARAGLIPRITAPGVVPNVDVWRVVAMLPGERGTNPFVALAEELLRVPEAISEDEDKTAALPEIAESGYRTPKELADLLAHADSAATKPIAAALDKLAEKERAAAGYDRPVNAALVLLIDQLDELFAADVTDETRQTFAQLLSELVKTGRVWIVATLRADLYERFLLVPELLALKQAGTAYDLSPPGPAELAEIVREPARAADLRFEADASGRTLDERLLADAERADMLPLVQFTLNRLFDERVTADGETRLTHAAYDALGGLDGAIDNEAERAISGLRETEIARLPRLLRELAAPARAGEGEGPASLTVRSVPLSRATHDEAARRLVDTLVDARILLSSGEGGGAAIRVAHQRVLESWKRAQRIVAENADFFRIREEVEDERKRWETGGRKRTRLIPSGVPLAEAESIAKTFRDELPADTRAFIAASGNRARLRQRLTAAAAIVFLGVAVAAGYMTWRTAKAEQLAAERATAEAVARQQAELSATAEAAAREEAERAASAEAEARQQAEQSAAAEAAAREEAERLAAAEQEARERAEELATSEQAAREEAERLAAAEQEAREQAQQLAAAEQAAREQAQQLAAAEQAARQEAERNFETAKATVDGIIFDIAQGLRNVEGLRLESLRLILAQVEAAMERLTEAAPDDLDVQRSRMVMLNNFGDIYLAAGDGSSALTVYQEALDIARRLAEAQPDNIDSQRDVSVSLMRIGDVKLRVGDTTGAETAYDEAFTIVLRLTDVGPSVTLYRDVTVLLNRLADVNLRAGQTAIALDFYERSLSIVRQLAALDPNDTGLQRDVMFGLNRIGDLHLRMGEGDAALTSFEEGLATARRLSELDPGNLQLQLDVSIGLDRTGDVKLQNVDIAGALAAYEESLEIRRRLAEQDPENAEWQRGISVSLDKIGAARFEAEEFDLALAAFEESLALRRLRLEQDPANVEWQRDLLVSLNQIGDVRFANDNTAGALEVFEEALAVARRLTAQDPNNTVWQRDLSVTLNRLGEAELKRGNADAARTAYEEGLSITRLLSQRDPASAAAQFDLAVSLYRVATVSEGAALSDAVNEGLELLASIEERGLLTEQQQEWPEKLRALLPDASETGEEAL